MVAAGEECNIAVRGLVGKQGKVDGMEWNVARQSGCLVGGMRVSDSYREK